MSDISQKAPNSGLKVSKSDWAEALKVFGLLSVWIVFPVLIGVLAGKWLDKTYHSDPKWFLICVGAAFAISMVGLVKNTLKEYKNIEKDFPAKAMPTELEAEDKLANNKDGEDRPE